ncbi:MAG: CpaF family protein [Armatimonadetes bacterium]|nr:CpaF family protein [Armatimonadota bacterium]
MGYEMLEKDQAYDLETSGALVSEMSSKKFVELVVSVHERMLEGIDAAELQSLSKEEKLRRSRETVTSLLKTEGLPLPSKLRHQIAVEAVAEISGYGPIQPLLDDPTITEIMVNGPDKIYIERDGKLYRESRVFKDTNHVMRVIERIVLPLGRRIDESSPMVDARLPDGSRVNAIIPPLAVKGPTLTVRKFSKEPYTVDDLVRFGTMTDWMAEFFSACVQAKLNILVSGGTGSGKTTTLNVLSSFVPSDERIVTIEDAAELQLQQEHVVTLESRPANLEGRGEIAIRQLVRNALRMRPDRIIVGEVRGGEALDMLQAMNTGHDGSLSTAHTNSPRDALARLETMTLMAGTDLPSRAVREQIAAAMNLIVHQARLRDGSRKVVQVSEVQGMEGDVIVLQDIFIFDQKGVDANGNVIGEHKPTGLRPKFIQRLAQQGIELPVDVFRFQDDKRRRF